MLFRHREQKAAEPILFKTKNNWEHRPQLVLYISNTVQVRRYSNICLNNDGLKLQVPKHEGGSSNAPTTI